MSLIALTPFSYAKDKITIQNTLSCKKTADCPYLFDVVDGDKTFKRALQNFAKLSDAKQDAKWIVNGGTSSPSTPVILDKITYAVFGTCEPHNCGSNHYVLAYNPETKKIYGLHTTDLPKKQTFIGNPSTNLAALLKSYEEGELLEQLNDEKVKLPLIFNP